MVLLLQFSNGLFVNLNYHVLNLVLTVCFSIHQKMVHNKGVIGKKSHSELEGVTNVKIWTLKLNPLLAQIYRPSALDIL